MNPKRTLSISLVLVLLWTCDSFAQSSGWTIALDSARVEGATIEGVVGDTLIISPPSSSSVYGNDPGPQVSLNDIVYIAHRHGSSAAIGLGLGLLAGGIAALALPPGDARIRGHSYTGFDAWVLPIAIGPLIGAAIGALAQPQDQVVVLEGRDASARSAAVTQILARIR